jgi:2'-hydroxyisoflavone reductase
MRILMIGGTSFVGRHITERAVERGHTVTLFNRGQTNPGAFSGLEHVRGDRQEGTAGLAGLDGRQFDATVDVCAYVPARVRELLGVLGSGVGLYTFISTISVYPEDVAPGFDETAPLLSPSYSEELTIEEYGALKVGCEYTAAEIVGDRLLVVRPGYVIGPYDPTGRFTYWVERVARAAGGPMLGPAAEQPLQAIDGRDLAAFTVGLVETSTTGAFNGTAPDPALRFAEALPEIARGIGAEAPDVHWSKEHEQLPLTDGPEHWGQSQADLTKGRAHGLAWRPLAQTSRDLYDWVSAARAAGTYIDRAPAMTPELEAQLLG